MGQTNLIVDRRLEEKERRWTTKRNDRMNGISRGRASWSSSEAIAHADERRTAVRRNVA
jgi:hypothetical protein